MNTTQWMINNIDREVFIPGGLEIYKAHVIHGSFLETKCAFCKIEIHVGIIDMK